MAQRFAAKQATAEVSHVSRRFCKRTGDREKTISS